MKKNIIVGLLVLSLFSFTSCTKLYDIMPNDHEYSSLEVEVAYKFEIELEEDLAPFFEKEENELLKLDCIMAILVLSVEDSDREYTTNILILSKGEVHYGFVTGFETISGNILDVLNEEITFGSHLFLTSNNSIVKYYESDERTYSINFLFSEEGVVYGNVEGRTFKPNESSRDNIDFPVSIVSNSFEIIEPNSAYAFINKCKVDKVTFEAKVISFDKDKIKVSSKAYPTLKTFSCNILVDSKGYQRDYSVFIIKKTVELYFYQRFINYVPVNISVYIAVVK
ncbi:MAG: hypothetical protein LBM99_03165 [Bacillales bacterium]|jgi:hypothetical protein|nr:hypothetical protein [Bacillales bacterium]